MKGFFTFLAISELMAGFSTARGQMVEASKPKTTLYIPNQIKINSDGKLEKWVISHLDEYPENQLKLFNRRGQIVYQSQNYQNNWPETTPKEDKYFYILEIDGKRVSGWLEIFF
jgi:gliding motility-associated-like protein